MKQARKQRGFTIIEVLVVLAVTGAMFLLAVVAINGKQNQTEFNQAINDIRSEIQQQIDQVAAGDYPNTGNFTCNGTSGSLNILPGANKQGSNDGCVYLGKVLQFGVHGTDPQQYLSYTIAGLQDNNGNLTAAKPTAIAPGITTNTGGSFPNASVSNILHNGLTAVKMTSGGGNIGAVAFISNLGQYSGGSLLSGSQQISLIPVGGSFLDTTSRNTVDAINKNLDTSTVNPSGGVQICFASGGTNQSGLITIGSGGRELSVTLEIKDGRSC
jgi:prepilin-type N-terminal cleavage/methylation domain-containing protein